MNPRTLIFILCIVSSDAIAQVGQIKNKSSGNSSRRSEGGLSGASSASSVFFFFDMIRVVGSAQAVQLQRRDSLKRIVSLEAFFQGAIQPSTYYLLNPRIRGNWGLFSSDFRVNYLLEDDHSSGTHDLTTFDWQILQLNVINRRNVTARVGAGNLYEHFGSKQSFFEWTTGVSIFSNDQKTVGNIEYRVAKDYITNAIPRREINFSMEKQVFNFGRWRGYATIGGVYQRYYETISVWGLQAGMVIRVF